MAKRKNINKAVILFLAIALVRMIYIFFYNGPIVYPDSESYINYVFTPLFRLDFSEAGRTPVYPAILRICEKLFGTDGGLVAVTILQMIISYISVIFVYKTIRLFTDCNKIVFLVTFMYGSSSMVFGWDNLILTESLALSGTVFFIYVTIQYIKTNTVRFGVIAEILLLILTFLRPSFLPYNMIFTVFLIIRILLKKIDTWKVMLGCLFNWSVILGYSALFYSAFGIFTISDPMPRQLMDICIERGYYQNYEDKQFVKMIEDSMKTEEDNIAWKTMEKVMEYYGHKETQAIAVECIRNNMRQYIVDELEVALDILASDWGSYSTYRSEGYPIIDLTDKIFNNIKPVHSILLGTGLLISAIAELIIKKRICWIAGGLGTFIVAVFVFSIIATCGEFIRTMICIVPMTYLALAYVLSRYICKEESFAIENIRNRP